jgi:hypothetical protein
MKFNKNKYKIIVIGSWLITKLQLTFELSRLAFFRTARQAEIRFVLNRYRRFPASSWCFENNRLSFLNYHEQAKSFILHRLPALNKN